MGHWRGPHLGTAKVTPFPQSGLGAYKGTLWDPIAEFAGVKVAGNSNLKLGDTPRAQPRGRADCAGGLASDRRPRASKLPCKL